MTREQFERLKVGDKVRHAFGGIGVVTEKDNGTYTVKDKGFDQGDGMCEVSFAWNEGDLCFPSTRFKEGDMVISTVNPHLTYKILQVGLPNELGKLDYQVEIFTDGKAGMKVGNRFEEHNIHLISCDKMDEWGKLFTTVEEIGVAEPPSKTFPRVNEFECGSSYRR